MALLSDSYGNRSRSQGAPKKHNPVSRAVKAVYQVNAYGRIRVAAVTELLNDRHRITNSQQESSIC